MQENFVFFVSGTLQIQQLITRTASGCESGSDKQIAPRTTNPGQLKLVAENAKTSTR